MNGLELFLLGRKLMKLGEEAIPAGVSFRRLPTSVRTVLIDVMEHPGSSVGEITARTGFPQSHVSAAVARLRDEVGFVTEVDPADRRRTLVRASPEVHARAAQITAATPVDGTLATALGVEDPAEVAEIVATLEALARRLTPGAGGGEPSPE